jgi:hypothetical protein
MALPRCGNAITCVIDKKRYTFFARDTLYRRNNTQMKKFTQTVELGQLSQYSDEVVGWTVRVSIPGKCDRFSPPPKRLGCLCDPTNFPPNREPSGKAAER